MTDLEETFGEEFAENIKQKTAERRQERNRVTQKQLAEICAEAINENRFDDGEPQFNWTTENGVTHTVLLVQVPDPDGGEVWEHLSEPWDGAARLPLEYLGEWYWSTFPQKDDLKPLEQGDWAIVVGSIEENEGDDGDVFRNIYPVRGIATLAEAKECAEEAMSEEGFSKSDDDEEKAPEPDDFAGSGEEDEEPEEEEETDDSPFDDDDDEEEEEEESSSGGSGGGLKALAGGDDDEEEEEDDDDPVDYDEVAGFIEDLAEKQDEDEEPQIMELEEGDDQLQKLVQITVSQTGEENEEGVLDVILDVIEGHRDEEEEEEDDDDDLEGKLF